MCTHCVTSAFSCHPCNVQHVMRNSSCSSMHRCTVGAFQMIFVSGAQIPRPPRPPQYNAHSHASNVPAAKPISIYIYCRKRKILSLLMLNTTKSSTKMVCFHVTTFCLNRTLRWRDLLQCMRKLARTSHKVSQSTVLVQL